MIHRDQIHGDVRFDPLAVELLNTEALQRLGRVYQLGYAHLVFRGGTHTRLSHVMGASHVAGWLVDQLRQNYLEPKADELPPGAVGIDNFLPTGRSFSQKETAKPGLDARWEVVRYLVNWAALLHDAGHVPLGHTLEDEFEGIYKKHDDFASPRIPQIWLTGSNGEPSEIRRVFNRPELLPDSFSQLGIDGETAWQTVMLICLHKEGKQKEGGRESFRQVLSKFAKENPANEFVKLLATALGATEGKTFFPYMADIVGNTICADYFDYLRRDPTNVGLDVLRDNRVATRFFIGKDENGLLRMALALVDRRGKPRLDVCTSVVELVRQRFRFAEIIYYHKTKVAASAMLAKVFTLLGQPDEVGPSSQMIEIDQVSDLAREAIKPKGAAKLRRQYAPSNLLSPEIGDETLLFWLQNRGWDALAEAEATKDADKAANCLRALSLLQGLVRRKLYKTRFTINGKAFKELCPGSDQDHEVERGIKRTHDRLRSGDRVRGNLEANMAAAAGWPENSVLLYVPPRKSQAKGIETGALDRGQVITLGEHSAVKEDVDKLSKAYKDLWRIILLVHPKYAGDDLGLSKAVDALVQEIWPEIDLVARSEEIREIARFNYIPGPERYAAQTFQSLMLKTTAKPDWRLFRAARTQTSSNEMSPREHAYRAALSVKVQAGGGSPDFIREEFEAPESLSERMSQLEPQLTLEGHSGDVTPETRTMAALDRIAEELVVAHQPSLFSKPAKK